MVEDGRLPREVLDVRIEIADPKNPEHGDFACNFAMTASKVAGKNPRELAQMLVDALNSRPLAGERSVSDSESGEWAKDRTPTSSPRLTDSLAREGDRVFDSIEIAGPGFINLTLNPVFVASFVGRVNSLEEGELAKQSPVSAPQKINVEFVSVNPNGPITIGSGRGAAYGSTLCNVLEAAGNTVHREYYINDGVNSEQMRLFAESVRAIVRDLPVPSNGYHGDYVREVANEAQLDSDLWDRLTRESRRELSILQDLNSSIVNEVHERLKSWSSEAASIVDDTEREARAEALRLELVADLELALKHEDLAEVKWQIAESDHGIASELFRQIVMNAAVTFGSLRGHLPTSAFQAFAQTKMIAAQRTALAAFDVNYDTWFSEQSLHDAGMVAAEIEALHSKGIADTELARTKLKLAKGGKLEDVIVESQTAEVNDEGEVDVPPTPSAEGAGGQGVGDDAALESESTSVGGEEPQSITLAPSERGKGIGETLWLRSTKLGDDMDRVLRRKDGRLTYIASDVAYHKDKFNRPAGADKLITILGPDHHGYIGRLTAVVAAMLMQPTEPGAPCEDPLDAKLYRDVNEKAECARALAEAKKRLEVQIYQLVRFMKDGKPAPMRKRDGNIYALIDLMREIGVKLKPEGSEAKQLEAGKDVARFFYLMRSHDTTFDFDLDLAEKQSDENPVFYVQYAHARICSILDKAEGTALSRKGDLTLLTHPKEKALIKRVVDLPNEVARAAEDYGVHRLATYAIELARAFHGFYGDCKVISDDAALTAARLDLCRATKRALQETLNLLGVSAPTKM